MKKIDKHYISEIDKKLAEFDESHEKSAAQQAEYNKYQRIYQLRDEEVNSAAKKDDLWD